MAMNRDMMAKLAQMQERLAKAQSDLAEKRAEGSSGGGAIHIVVTGGMKVESLKIDKEVVDPDDVEMLEDLVLAAVGDGLRRAQELQGESMGSVTGGLDLGALGDLGGLLG